MNVAVKRFRSLISNKNIHFASITMSAKEFMTPVIVISGVSSGVGKTSIAVGIMAALHRRGLRVQPFKVGPDFLDPMHHSIACGGVPSVNLDGWMMGREGCIEAFQQNCIESNADVAVIEGCMGLYDGADGTNEVGSTAEIAKWVGAPVVLVVDAWCLSRSAAAMVHGYASFDADIVLAGVVFNKIGGESHSQWLKQALLSSPLTTAIELLGCVPKNVGVTIEERHLGLEVPVNSKEEGSKRLDTLSMLVETHVQLDLLMEIARREAEKVYEKSRGVEITTDQQIDIQKVRIHIYIYLHVCIYMYIYIFIHIHMYTYMYIYLNIQIYINIHIYISYIECEDTSSQSSCG
jgi:cobyrinic acid a,c-diamide synthase